MSFITFLTFAKKHHETDDVYTFSFTAKHNPSQQAGQHGIFMLPGLYRPHPFSLSSSPGEEYVTFSTHTATGSAFKRNINAMEPGAKMLLIGPVMNFTYVKNKSKHVFLAQGIGITPFRSMLVHAYSERLPISTTLIHVDGKAHTFKDITQKYSTKAFYPTNPKEFQDIVKNQDINQTFYVSGSPRFVRATKKLLRDMCVTRKNIKTDSFLGY